jgi:hypothetical protein
MDSNLVECFGLICISALLSWDISCLCFSKYEFHYHESKLTGNGLCIELSLINHVARKVLIQISIPTLIFLLNKCLIKWFHIFDLFTTLEM